MAPKKYIIEHLIHGMIRDIPEINKANAAYEKGMITLDDFLVEIIKAHRKERSKA